MKPWVLYAKEGQTGTIDSDGYRIPCNPCSRGIPWASTPRPVRWLPPHGKTSRTDRTDYKRGQAPRFARSLSPFSKPCAATAVARKKFPKVRPTGKGIDTRI